MMGESTARKYWSEAEIDGRTLETLMPLRRFTTAAEQVIRELLRSPLITVGSSTVDFRSNSWDFTDSTEVPVMRSALRITFGEHRYNGLVKVYFLYTLVSERGKVQSLISKARIANRLAWLAEEQGIASLSLLTSDIMGAYLKARKAECSPLTVSAEATVLTEFLTFYEAAVGPLCDSKIYSLLASYHYVRKNRKTGSFSPVPALYLERLIAACIRILRDEGEPLEARMTACAIVIISQTGMRVCELIGIETDALRISKAPAEGEIDIPYIVFMSPKPAKGDNQWVEARCIMNEPALEAFSTALRIGSVLREKKGSHKLIVYQKQQGSRATHEGFDSQYKRFLLNHRAEIPCINTQDLFPTLGSCPARNALSQEPKGKENRAAIFARRFPDLSYEEDVLVYPRNRQFRSTVATELRKRGIEWRFIQTQMTHLNMDSMDSYIYDHEDTDEKYSEAIYRLVFGGEVRMMGKHADEFMAKVRGFVQEGRMNVADDLDEVVALAAGRFPLREKLGGICIRCGQVVPCEEDEPTDRLLCAFNACPNHCHFFFNIKHSYSLAKERAAIIEENDRRGWVKASNNERKKLHNILDSLLLPQLVELEKEIRKHGGNAIAERHPELKEIIGRLDAIKKEVEAWKTQQKS